MNASVMSISLHRLELADRALGLAARSWFIVAFAGHALFAAYIAGFYGITAVMGEWGAWAEVLPEGIRAGDPLRNAALGTHLLFALIITVGGPLQLLPLIRARFPTFHRWNGRTYASVAVIASLTGLFMVWTGEQTVGDTSQHVAISINAALIILCVCMAWRAALRRDTATHQVWALRLFLCVSGVWFFRVGLMLWLTLWQAPVGFDPKTFSGPTLTVLAFAQYLVPLAVFELYRLAQRSSMAAQKIAVTALLTVATLSTALGIAGAAAGMWLPRLTG